jgi:hypothetical protein
LKETIPKHIYLDVDHAGLSDGCGEHAMCLEQLMKEDAIEESAHADA